MAPSGARWWRAVIPALSGLLLILAACASAPHVLIPARTPTSPPAAAALLARAAAAPLHDATFTLLVLPGQPGTASGTGMLTTQPKRLEILLGATLDTQWGRIAAGAAYYEKLTSSPTWFKVTDASTLLQNDGEGGWLFFLDPLDYGHLQGAAVRGAETLDGVSTWHLSARWMLPAPLADEVASAAGGGATSVAEDLWLDQTNAYPVRVDLHQGPVGEASPIEDVSFRFTAWDSDQVITLPPTGGSNPLAVAVRPSPWACAALSHCAPAGCAADSFPCFQLAGCSVGDGADNYPSFILRDTGGSAVAWSGTLWSEVSVPPAGSVTLTPSGGVLAPGATQTVRLHGTGPGSFEVALTAGGHTVLVTVQCHNG